MKAKLLRLFVCGCVIVMQSHNLSKAESLVSVNLTIDGGLRHDKRFIDCSFKQRGRVFEIVGKEERLLVKPPYKSTTKID